MENVTIKDLTFDNVSYVIEAGRCKGLYYAAIAGEIISSTITNVTINGSFTYAESVINQYVNEKGPLSILSLTDPDIIF